MIATSEYDCRKPQAVKPHGALKMARNVPMGRMKWIEASYQHTHTMVGGVFIGVEHEQKNPEALKPLLPHDPANRHFV